MWSNRLYWWRWSWLINQIHILKLLWLVVRINLSDLFLIKVIFLQPLDLLGFSIFLIKDMILKDSIFQILLRVSCLKRHHKVRWVIVYESALEHHVGLNLLLVHLHAISHLNHS